MSFGDVIRQAASPGTAPNGMGGDASTIWSMDGSTPDTVYELSITDFSVIRSAAAPTNNTDGLGGDSSVIWHNSLLWDKVYELSIVDFSTVRSGTSPTTKGSGIGGSSNTIWYCDSLADEVYELSTTDFSTIRFNSSPAGNGSDIGGTDSVIWYCCIVGDDVFELSTVDFSTVQSTASPGPHPNGIGGSNDTIWHCDLVDDKVYELDVGTYTISGNVKDSDGNNLNNVTIALVNSTNYSTSTNVSGNYSQAVNPDVYTITASLTGYLSSSISVDASTGDQTQNFILLKPVISGNVKDSNGNNLNNVTISLNNSTSYETNTDANGNYLQIVDPDVYTVTASKDKYLDSSASVDVTTSNQTQNFVLSKPVISGNIKDNKGYNINGVIVIFTDDTSYETTTDSSGNYSQEVDPDEYNVAASLTGYIPDSADIDASSSDKTQDFTLDRTTVRDKGIYLGNRYLLNDIVDN